MYVGENACTMNIHLLCHMCECVANWGPLWCYSCFPFESVNGRLKTHYHGTRSMNKQLGFSYIMLQILPKRAKTENNRYVFHSSIPSVNTCMIVAFVLHKHLLETYVYTCILDLMFTVMGFLFLIVWHLENHD